MTASGTRPTIDPFQVLALIFTFVCAGMFIAKYLIETVSAQNEAPRIYEDNFPVIRNKGRTEISRIEDGRNTCYVVRDIHTGGLAISCVVRAGELPQYMPSR